MDISSLTSKLIDHSRGTFLNFVETHGRSELIGFALYTSEGYPGLGAAGATKGGQAANELCSATEFQFECDEWDNMTAFSGTVSGIIAQWYREGDAQQTVNPSWFDEYCDGIIRASVDALAQLIEDGLFGTEAERDDLFLMLGVSDSLISYTTGLEWSARLNTPTMHERYKSFAKDVVAGGNY